MAGQEKEEASGASAGGVGFKARGGRPVRVQQAGAGLRRVWEVEGALLEELPPPFVEAFILTILGFFPVPGGDQA